MNQQMKPPKPHAVSSVRVSISHGCLEMDATCNPLRLLPSDARRVAMQLIAGANKIEQQAAKK